MTVKDGGAIQLESDVTMPEGDLRWVTAQRAAHSSQLSRAAQLQSILLFIVRQAIVQPEERICEVDIAHHVLGRRHDFNPVDDNIVRVQIARLRKKLDLYFSTEGKHEQVVINIELGSYKPIFVDRCQPVPTPQSVPQIDSPDEEDKAKIDEGMPISPIHETRDTIPEVPSASFRRRWKHAGLILSRLFVLVLACGCVALWVQNRAMRRSIEAMHQSFHPRSYGPTVEAFWSDFLGVGRDTDIVMADRFFNLMEHMYKKSFTLNDYLSHSYLRQLLSQEKNSDMVEVLRNVGGWNTASSDHLKLARRIQALGPVERNIRLYFAREYTTDSIKQDNVILLGSRYTNPWDDVFEGRMNFTWMQDGNDVNSIMNSTPAVGEQKIYTQTDTVGYCVVAYLPNLSHNGKVLVIEGTNSEVTEAGGDFLLSEDQLSLFQNMLHVTKLPYFEVLLRASEVNGTPLAVKVAAYRTYPNLH